MTLPIFLLIDGHSLAFRSYYAFAKGRDGGLKTASGIPTSVCFGFLKTLLEIMAVYPPECVTIAFDLGKPTFRHDADPNYKADRAEAPADLLVELDNLQELLLALNLTICTAPGYEADDVIGTLAQQASQAGYQVKIVSGDRDLFQLVSTEKSISVLYLSPGKGSVPTEFKVEDVTKKLGVKPTQVADYKALCGDPSDNIAGVKGIGEKTAAKLLQEYESLAGIYANIEKIKGGLQQKLIEGKADADHSQFMAKIIQDLALPITLDQCQLRGCDRIALEKILAKLELKTFLDKIDEIQAKFGEKSHSLPTSEGAGENAGKREEDQENSPMGEELGVTSNNADNDDTWFFPSVDAFTNFAHQIHHNLPFSVQIIDTFSQLNDLLETLKTCVDPSRPVAWDTETTGLVPRDAKLVGIGCCWGTNKTDIAYIPVGHQEGKQLEINQVLAVLKHILESPEYPKVFQNAKFDRLILRSYNIHLQGVVFDTMLASYLIAPEEPHNLKDLARKYLQIEPTNYDRLVNKNQTMADIEIELVANYCGNDVYSTFHLVPIFQDKLAQMPQVEKLLQTVELPLEPVLAKMEYQGIRIDSKYLMELSQEIDRSLAKIAQPVYDIAGETFNLDSPKQLSKVLFETLKLDTKKSRKIKMGYSTDATVLEKLQGDHPIIDYILENRTLAKLKSTYVDALPQLVRKDTRRVHTSFNQTVTSTGRLSSSEPNLQNIPAKTTFSRQIRKAFLPQENWLLVAADYSQIELRILAHLSQEPVLLNAYQNNQDVHTVTAQLLFEKQEITPDERRLGKTINFGVIYGMGPQKFSRTVGVSIAQGKKFIDRFYDSYPRVFAYLETIKKQAVSQGFVETILGRRRYFQFEADSLRKLKGSPIDQFDLSQVKTSQNDAQFLRAAANAPIQGSSADIIKKAMVELDQFLDNYQARILLQVHDELVLEMPPEEWDELKIKVIDIMQNAVSLSVPLLVDIHAGKNWMETK